MNLTNLSIFSPSKFSIFTVDEFVAIRLHLKNKLMFYHRKPGAMLAKLL